MRTAAMRTSWNSWKSPLAPLGKQHLFTYIGCPLKFFVILYKGIGCGPPHPSRAIGQGHWKRCLDGKYLSCQIASTHRIIFRCCSILLIYFPLWATIESLASVYWYAIFPFLLQATKAYLFKHSLASSPGCIKIMCPASWQTKPLLER